MFKQVMNDFFNFTNEFVELLILVRTAIQHAIEAGLQHVIFK